MLPAAEGEVEVVHIQDKHTKQYGGQDEPRALIVFFPLHFATKPNTFNGEEVVSVSSFLILNTNRLGFE